MKADIAVFVYVAFALVTVYVIAGLMTSYLRGLREELRWVQRQHHTASELLLALDRRCRALERDVAALASRPQPPVPERGITLREGP